MSTFYFGDRTRFVLGTSPYYVQEVNARKQENELTAVPQSNAIVEPRVQYHEREDLPPLEVNLAPIKKEAARDVVKILDERVAPKARKARTQRKSG